MATYFDGSNNNNTSPDINSSLYLMNPNNYVPFSRSHSTSTSNSASTHHAHALNFGSVSHAPPQHHLIGLTIPSSNIVSPANADEISGSFAMAAGAPRVHYNLWGSSVDSINDRSPSSVAGEVTVAALALPNNTGHDVATVTGLATVEVGSFHRPGDGLHQGLSLGLSSQQPSYRTFSGKIDVVSLASHGGNKIGMSSMHGVVLGSKYLKVAQELLDEVVNVGNNKGISIIEGSSSNKEKMKGNIIVESSYGVGDNKGISKIEGSSSGGGENNNNSNSNSVANNNKQGGELSTAQRQELQMKKSKLVNMLHEVEERYREYHQQMEVVTSSLEEAVGYGSARSYTSLALNTISKQFRCLKDAISAEIRATSKAMGEEDNGDHKGSMRLRFVDQHLWQHRALQQLGIIHHQHNTWRPQRGLPQRAVSILRAWLFDHFLHPYPKDSDKVMLAKQTGLTRSQVSNWFINARVRLWKPMVEEMYLEEVKDHQDQNIDQINILQSKTEETFNNNNQNTSPTEISNSNKNNNPIISPTLLSSNMGGGGGGGQSGNFLLSPNKSKPQNSQSSILSSSMDMESMNHNDKHNGDNNNNNIKFGIIDDERNNHNDVIGGYGASFSIQDIGRFNNHHHHHQHQLGPRFHGNGVSLTLGLPPSDQNNNHNLQHHGFLSHLGGNNNNNNNENHHEFCGMNSTTTPHQASSHSGTSYDNIEMQNRKRFNAHLLRDLMA